MQHPLQHLRVVLVHDWLNGMRGGEKCLEVLCELFPDAPVYTLFYDPARVSPAIRRHTVRVSWLQLIPGIYRLYRYLLPLYPLAARSWRLPRDADLVVSLSHCVAKSADPGGVPHLCYCFTPMRYLWDLSDVYFFKGFGAGLKRLLLKPLFDFLRRFDRDSNASVDSFVAISNIVRDRIRRHYGRDSVVVFPPVDTDFYTIDPAVPEPAEPFYLVVSALVPYKRIDLAVRAFSRSGLKLRVVGSGPELARLRRLAAPNVTFEGWLDDGKLRVLYNQARALIFPGVEDFGIVPLEANACGTPVVAFRAGGALDTVFEYGNGVFFDAQTVESLNEAVFRLDKLGLDKSSVRNYALPFSRARYTQRMLDLLAEAVSARGGV